jgi:alkanesulfonate monooxygenase SsuD/methylene tetrahydromethanopterin reductase-like flavin-dependent oxidoreductase (luciferase family)
MPAGYVQPMSSGLVGPSVLPAPSRATDRPALSLVASTGKRAAVLELAAEADRRGFAGIACPSIGNGPLGLCASLAHVTTEIPFWTSVQPIYLAHAVEVAGIASHIREVSRGRFSLGLGVSHDPMTRRLGVTVGKPLDDTRQYVGAVRAATGARRTDGPTSPSDTGDLTPPIYLAALRDKMLGLAAEIADGAIWANAARSAVGAQLRRVPAAGADGFFRANMIPTVIDEDRAAAAAINRRTMTGYLSLPNYRNYWRTAGYEEEMDAIEAALLAGERDRLPGLISDRWLHDVTVSGPAADVRDGLAAWAEAGVLPIAVMSSTSGGQVKAVQELFEAFT